MSTAMADIQKLSAEEIEAQLKKTRQELFEARFQHGSRQLEDTASLPRMKKQVARLLTALRAKRSGVVTAPSAKAENPEKESKETNTQAKASKDDAAKEGDQ